MEPRFIDTHAHLGFTEYREDRSEVIDRALNTGVEKIVNVATRPSQFKTVLELSFTYDFMYAAIGVHPHESASFVINQQPLDSQIKKVVNTLKTYGQYASFVGVGEIGLDFYHLAREHSLQQSSIRNVQVELFTAQVRAAMDMDKPIIVHGRDAYPELIKILKEFNLSRTVKGVIHSYEGDYKTAKSLMDQGMKISFSGMVTYDQFRNQYFLEAVKKIPLTEMVLETDCPYLAPEPLRGQRNEPANLEYIAREIAAIRGVQLKTVAEKTSLTAEKLFNLT